jgi:ribosomal protein L11 methyltransferase
VDADPEAVEVARGVVAENGLTGRVELATGSAERPPAGRWDGVVANISSAFFLEQAPGLPGLLAPAGILLATGYVVDDRAAVAAALAAAGLEERERRESPPWGLLVLHRAG